MLAALATLLLPVGVVSGQTSTTLVSNTGQAQELTPAMVNDFAQAFTTGSNADGYVLTGVTLTFAVAGTPTYALELWSSNSSNQPGNLLATLSGPASLSVGANTFSAPGSGTDLAATTTYYLVWDLPSPQGQSPKHSFTNSNAEDSGAAAGWSIADNILLRQSQTTTWTSAVHSFRFSIDGYAAQPPTPQELAEQEAYAALESYFAGEATLSETEAVVENYYYALRRALARGELHANIDYESLPWWSEVPTTWYQVGPSTPGACGGEQQPRLERGDAFRFFWACTSDNQWVPVRLPRPGVDYRRDSELTWSGGCFQSAYDDLRGTTLWRANPSAECERAREEERQRHRS